MHQKLFSAGGGRTHFTHLNLNLSFPSLPSTPSDSPTGRLRSTSFPQYKFLATPLNDTHPLSKKFWLPHCIQVIDKQFFLGAVVACRTSYVSSKDG